MSLREEIDKVLLWLVEDHIDLTSMDDESKELFLLDKSSAIVKILTTISKHLPEAPPITHDLQHQQKMWRLGYSEAIDEVNKLLTTNKEADA